MNKPHSSLSQFIEEYPLYANFGTDQPIDPADLDKLAFNFFCKHENNTQPFRLYIVDQVRTDHNKSTNGSPLDFTEMFTGICQSCLNYKIKIVINGSSQAEKPKYFIRKVGQLPSPEGAIPNLPDEITWFLTDQGRDLYMKAIKDLEWQHGAAALTYFKKMIGAEMERIIDSLSDPYSSDGNKLNEVYQKFKQGKQKTTFLDEITSLLPESLQTHGPNSLVMLHEAASMAIDELTEAECTRKAKDIDALFRYIVKRIYTGRIAGNDLKPPGKYFLRYS
jgi:hypothetical protein